MYLTPSLFKCHHYFLEQFFVLTVQKIGYCSAGFGHLFQPDSMERPLGNQKLCQLVYCSAVGSFRTAGSAALKHNRRFLKGGAVLKARSILSFAFNFTILFNY